MRRSRCELCRWLTIGVIWIGTTGLLAAPTNAADLTDGQKVEVREGDTWSAATIVKREGRKYLIHYDGAEAANDEWVTTDRIRVKGTAGTPALGAPGAAPGTQPATGTPKPAATKLPIYSNGQKVEYKWGGLWKAGTVTNRRGEWYFMTDEHGWREWVEPWRLRPVGSQEDNIGYASPHHLAHRGDGPPTPVPGPAPEPFGARHHADPAKLQQEAAPDVPLTAIDHSQVKKVVLESAPPLLQLAPDPAPHPAKPWVVHPVALRGYVDGSTDANGLLMAPGAGVLGVVYKVSHQFGGPHATSVERLDLVSGQSLSLSEIPLELEALDLSPDGKLFVGKTSVFGPGRGARLDVWQVDAPDKAVHVSTLIPFENEHGGESIDFARFIDGDHLLVMHRGGQVSLFAFRKGTEIWTAKPGLLSPMALSGSGKYAAIESAGRLVIVEAATGKVLGSVDAGSHGAGAVAFKSDGTRLALTAYDELRVWDTSSGKIVAEPSLVGVGGQSIAWATDDYLVLDGRSLVSLKKNAILWTYMGLEHFGQREPISLEGRFWYLADQGRSHVVASVVLPDDTTKATLMAVGEPKMVIKPGTSVSLEVSVDGSVQDKVVAALTAKLKDNGLTIADNQPIKLVAKAEPGESREINYRRIGFGAMGQSDKITVQSVKQTIAFTDADGKPLWERVGTRMPPFFVSLKQGQSVEEAVADQMKPSALYFENTQIPKFIPKSKSGFGMSRLTPSGAEAMRPPPQGS